MQRRLKMNEKKESDSSGGQDNSSLEKLNQDTGCSVQEEQEQLPEKQKGDGDCVISSPTKFDSDSNNKEVVKNAGGIVKNTVEISVSSGKSGANEFRDSKVIPVLPKPVCSVRVNRNNNRSQEAVVKDVSSGTNNNSENCPTALASLSTDFEMPGLTKDSKILVVDCEQENQTLEVKNEPSDEELFKKEELRLEYEHQELLMSNQQLVNKLESEKSEIAKLKEEIQEMQTLYGYR